MSFTIGSLFDGSGGFPFAASLCGGVPVWASEIEPYPIAVTKSRFPDMKHLGSVTDINGGEIEPVDLITFGSPCQDLSIAGKRAGLKHTENGDDETTRSGLFMEAVRIIKEMREATNGAYPKFVLWENVPGAFSSNKGEDFRIVIEELIKIAEPEAPPVPASGKTGWPYADCYVGDGWSFAYRVFDAQYWGVPQRRRRIHAVLDLTDGRAYKILFERNGLRGYFAEGRTPWQGAAADAKGSTGADDREGVGVILYTLKIRSGCEGGISSCHSNAMKSDNPHSGIYVAETSRTLDAMNCGYPACNQSGIAVVEQHLFENHSQDARYKGPLDICPMLPAQLGTGGNNQPFVVEKERDVFCLQGNGIDRADTAGCNGKGVTENVSYTLNTIDRHAVCYAIQAFGKSAESDIASVMKARDYKDATDLVCECAGVDCRNMNEYSELYPTLQAKPNGGQPLNFSGAVQVRYTVRRLTPTECARLQGFPDKWGYPTHKDAFTDEEYAFWLNVRNTHAAINGKVVKDYTPAQMLTWYNKLHTDSSEYKMWGNGIALPTALYVMQGIENALNEQEGLERTASV